MYRAAVLALAVAAACHPSAAAPKAPAAPLPTTLDPVRIDAWLAAELEERGVVGAALVIVHEGAIVLAKGYGTRTLGTTDAITPDTPFAIGSVSKQLTCAAAYLLADAGKLAMEDKVAKYYPELVRAADITLDDLGAHLAGYRDYYPLDYVDAPRMTTPIAPDDLLAKYAGMPLDFEPRARWSYSNTGFVLLGRVVEKASGLAFGKYLEERIFTPLEMTHSAFGPPPGAATGHTAFLLGPVERAAVESDGWAIGAFGVYSSATDLAKWDLAFSTGKILSEASRKRMAAPHLTNDGRTHNYSCGLGVRVANGETVLSHTGAVEGFYAYNTFIPRMRSAVILLVNDAHAEVSDLQPKIVSLVLQRPQDIPVVPGASAEETVRTLVTQLQRGTLDRTRLGDDLNGYFDAKRIADAAGRLGKLGEPTITLVDRHERGNLEVTTFDLAFP
jgi:D-alanyl-D-alanine carboxypeptidase